MLGTWGLGFRVGVRGLGFRKCNGLGVKCFTVLCVVEMVVRVILCFAGVTKLTVSCGGSHSSRAKSLNLEAQTLNPKPNEKKVQDIPGCEKFSKVLHPAMYHEFFHWDADICEDVVPLIGVQYVTITTVFPNP